MGICSVEVVVVVVVVVEVGVDGVEDVVRGRRGGVLEVEDVIGGMMMGVEVAFGEEVEVVGIGSTMGTGIRSERGVADASCQDVLRVPSKMGQRRSMLFWGTVLEPAGGVLPSPARSMVCPLASSSSMPKAEFERETVVVTTSGAMSKVVFESPSA